MDVCKSLGFGVHNGHRSTFMINLSGRISELVKAVE